MKIALTSVFSTAALSQCGCDPCDPAVIDDIVMVGGLLQDGGSGTLSQNDDMYFAHAVRVGTEQGLRFARQPRIRLCNIVYGDDFLNLPPETLSCKFMMFNMIYHEPGADMSMVIDKRYYRQSPRSTLDGAWHAALCASGAGYAANIHAHDVELPTGRIARPPYEKIHDSLVAMTRQMDLLARVG